jgi:hypothetical protein
MSNVKIRPLVNLRFSATLFSAVPSPDLLIFERACSRLGANVTPTDQQPPRWWLLLPSSVLHLGCQRLLGPVSHDAFLKELLLKRRTAQEELP